MLEIMKADALTTQLDDAAALEIFDSFEKMYPEDVIEVSNHHKFNDGYTLTKLMFICNPRSKYTLKFKNLRTNKIIESSRNFFDTMKNIVENYSKIFEEQ